MTEGRKTWAGTVLGWFVTRDDKAEADELSDEGQSLPPTIEPVGDLPAAPGGMVDFEAVFAAFGIETAARDRLTKADGLLRSLPSGADPAVKRQIVEASLKAFNVPLDEMIEAACEQIQALDAYQRKGGTALKAFCDESDRRVAVLEQEIASIRAAMHTQVDDQKKMLESCNHKKLEVQRLLEFFGPEAVGRVVRNSPKLIDPSDPGASGAPSTN